MLDATDLIAHAIAALTSASGAFGATVKLLMRPLRGEMELLSRRIEALEKSPAEAWLDDEKAAERLGAAERAVAVLRERYSSVRADLERVSAGVDRLEDDLRHTVTDEEHAAFGAQVTAGLQQIRESIGYIKGKLKGLPSGR